MVEPKMLVHTAQKNFKVKVHTSYKLLRTAGSKFDFYNKNIKILRKIFFLGI